MFYICQTRATIKTLIICNVCRVKSEQIDKIADKLQYIAEIFVKSIKARKNKKT